MDLSLWVLRHNTLFLENGKYESLATTATSFIQTTASENKVLKLFTDQRVEENDALTKIENRIIFGDDNQDEPYYGPSPKVILEFMNEGERLGPQKTAEFIQRMKDTPTPSEYEE